ncbi:hypothetical protein EV361DRAFT_163003 [Lentinula raphanica]|uniref:Uncharacterized protein n=1 Tax=Lentinula raphanica TaxID=153919 RepID=A0AA38UB17_9AGAR|nr:hypothetical protein F5878DRAFT_727259 [Lentinula raphanica]KAJ3977013.1 hypothetical protein EV361DRAFT_163003 [Lentinula raphanica]
MAVDQIDEDHPLVLEITSLKAAASRFQDEAHSASLKLQRFSFDASVAQDRVTNLERENELLKTELAILRINPHPDLSPSSHPAVLQSQELTLSLRRLSDKLSLTEHSLLERTTELAHVTSELAKSRITVEGAYALAARTRGREEEGKVRERQLDMRIRELKEELKMEDLVVKQYADLVRSLEGRNSTTVHAEPTIMHGDQNNAASLIDGISEGKAGLQKLFAEFSVESEQLQAEVEKLRGELAASNTRLEAERKGAEADRILLASVQKEIEMLKIEDKSAAAMVSRYMKFSQASTNTLQNSFTTLKKRHSATIDTLSNQLANLTAQLQTSQATSDKLRTTLDELGKDIMRESYGRRREIALRLKFVVREEALQEAMGRWIRKGKEVLEQEQEHIPRHSLEKLLSDARSVYAVLDTPSASKAPLPPVSEAEFSPYAAPTGSLARIIAIEASVKSLVEELHLQTARRQELELAVAMNEPPPPVPVKHVTLSKGPTEILPNTVVNSDIASNTSESGVDQPDKQEHLGAMNEVDTREDITSGDVPQAPSAPLSSDAMPERIPSPSSLSHPIPSTGVSKESGSDVDTVSQPQPQMVVVPNSLEAESAQPIVNDELYPSTHALVTPTLEQELTLQMAGDGMEMSISKDIEPNPLITELDHINNRYEDLQRAFRDCHLALQDLRKTLLSSTDNPSGASAHIPNGPYSHLYEVAIERLDDYNEDARVELEIRVADEALLAQGYQTMLSLPGLHAHDTTPLASSSYSMARSLSQDSQQDSELSTDDLEAQIRDFVSGKDLNVQRARQNLSRKLADVQNDIAVLKRALHDPDALGPPSPSTISPANGVNSHFNGGSGWASWIRGQPSRPASPSLAPTFGHVMTNPRLKHSASFHHDLAPKRRGSVTALSSQQSHPFANLDLRVSMPPLSPTASSSRSGVFSPPGLDWHGPRTRTVSTMNMLGLGTARSAASADGGNSSPRPQRTVSLTSDEEGKEDSDDDVE